MQVSAVARGGRAVPAPVPFVAQRVLRSFGPIDGACRSSAKFSHQVGGRRARCSCGVCGLGVVAHFAFESGRKRAKIAISEDAEGYSEAEEGT